MGTSRTIVEEKQNFGAAQSPADRGSIQRLEILLKENAASEKDLEKSQTQHDSSKAGLVNNPIPTENAVARLGLLTGAMPTSAIFLKMIFGGNGNIEPGAAVALTLIILISIAATATTGYFSGKLTGRILADLEEKPWPLMLLALPFVGMTWGLISGAAGGFILLGIGALFGGAIGAVVGAAVLTLFGILHRSTKEGDVIERNKFLPIAIGIAGTVAAFILGL